MAEQKQEQQDKDFRYFVRIANTDLDGNKAILQALRKIKGVNFMFANAICNIANVNKSKKAGKLADTEINKLDEIIKNPSKFNMPNWLFNRREDPDDGTDKHLITGNLIFSQENDIKLMKKIRSYRGVRHIYGLPARGQRTKSNFRKNKGKSSLGVKKKEVKKGRI